MRQATVLPRGRGDLAIVLRAVVRRGSLLFAGLVAFSLATSGKLSAQDAETLERLQRGIQTPRGIEDSELRALESLERRGLTGENARRRLRLEAPGDFEAGASADSRTRDDEREQGEGAGRSGASKDASAGSEGNGGGESAAGARARRLASEELERLSAFERQLLAYEDPLVGRPVRQFGYDVFGTPRTGIGRPVVDADYVIDVGDELAVSLWGQAVDDDYQVRVDARGDVRLPLVGVVSVRGLTLAQATAAMRAVFDEKFQDYEIRVRLVGRAREMHVHVVGRIERPGRVAVAWGASLFDAIAAAGGITKDGSLRRIRLRRAGEDDRTIDLYDYLLAGDPAVDVELARDDVILVPPIGAQVAIVGRVRRAAIYELEGESLEWSGLLDLAGGFARLADRSTIQVESVTESGLSVRAVELEGEDVAAADLSFRDGDVVLVRAAHPRVERVVYVAGNVSLPGRYAWREGMRVSDLIDENVLVDAGFWRGRIAPDSAPSELELPEPYLEFALLRRIDARTSQERRIAFHLGRALAEKGGREDHLLEPQDTIVIYPRDAFEAPLMTFVSGAVHQPGDHRWFPGMRVSDLVRMAGGPLRQAHLSSAILTRIHPDQDGARFEHIAIDLAAALAGEKTADIELEPDDSLAVKVVPEYRKPIRVLIEGEVRHPGRYTMVPGERLSDLIERAGGFTDVAYLPAGQFYSETVREEQKRNLDDSLRRLEVQSKLAAQQFTSEAAATGEVIDAQAELRRIDSLIETIRATPVLGRRVIFLRDVADLRGSEVDFELREGDRLIVPRRPQEVHVVGAVFNQAALLYKQGLTARDYLHECGGELDNSDMDLAYIIRADGTADSARFSRGRYRWDSERGRYSRGDLLDLELEPGDTLVIPYDVRPQLSTLGLTKTVTQILFQAALSTGVIVALL